MTGELAMVRGERFMTTAIVVSALAHAAIILGIKIVRPDLLPSVSTEFMQVELVNKATATAPTKAKVRAQVDQDAGGNTDADKQVSSPLPAKSDQFNTELQQVMRQEQELEQNSARLMAQIKSQIPATVQQLQDAADKSQQTQSTGVDREKLNQQIKDLSGAMGKIDQENQEYQQRPRKARIGLPANKSLTAVWEDQWKLKIERLGTTLYPVDANGNKLYGKLTLTAEINEDGTLRSATIDTSSGNPKLDEAALQIVHRSAPFSRLPKGLVDENGNHATVLVVVRRWSFTKDLALQTSSGR